MAEIIRMPKMSDTMTEGVIASWQKKVGDTVKSGDVLAEVETDKATMELESYSDGTLLYIGVEEKASVAVDGVLAVIGKAGEDFKAQLDAAKNGNGQTQPAPAEVKEQKQPETQPQAAAPAPSAPAAASAPQGNGKKATVIRMPKMSDTMTEGNIVNWLKKVGDKVKAGDVLAEVETDKATMELEAYEDGTLLHIGIASGPAQVDAVIAVIGEEGADVQAAINDGAAVAAPAEVKEGHSERQQQAQASPQVATGDQQLTTQADSRIKASPLARSMAKEKGLDIAAVNGTGEGGRIVARDVKEAQPGKKPAAPQAQPAAPGPKAAPTQSSQAPIDQEGFEEVPVSQMRKVIAKRLAESMYTSPHFYLTMDIDMTKAVESRKSVNDFTGQKISFNDMVLKATAAALRRHPKINSSWLGDKIRYNQHIHIGVAVAVDEGLLVPVVRFADQKSLTQIAAEVKDLGAKAKNKQLQPKDWEGNTFTISNLGMFGIDEFTAIINPPDACILAVGGIRETPVVRNGEIKIASMMKVTLSCDHRVVDGALGAAFLQTLQQLLEDPIRILA